MKIGFVLDDTLDKPDGVQQYVLMLGRWLSAQGHEVHYLVSETQRTDIPNVHSLGGYVRGRFNGNHVRTPLPVGRKHIMRLLDQLNLDVLHVQMPYSPFFGGRVVRLAGNTPVLATFHILPYTTWQRLSNHVLGRLQRRSAARLRAVMAPTPAAAEFAARAYGVLALVAPHPIDIDHFGKGRRLTRFDDGKLNIVFLGRLVERKGALALIRAYMNLDPRVRTGTRLIIAGAGPQLEAAKALAQSATDILFEGYVEESDKPDYLASADLAVFPAYGGESFGIVLTEAMASGSGVVLGGNNPGYAGVLSGMPACLFDPTDIRAFSDTLNKFILDTDLRHEMNTLQQIYIKDFDLNSYGKTLVSRYEHAASNN